MPEHRRPPQQRAPIRPDRVRCTDGGFAFVPNRFLHGGYFASLTHLERSLYFFLVLAGDRDGVSFYSGDRICATLEATVDDYIAARRALIDKDLVAFDGSRFQVLSLPPRPTARASRPLRTDEDFEREDAATIQRLIRSSLDER
jgi:hypothetical protein